MAGGLGGRATPGGRRGGLGAGRGWACAGRRLACAVRAGVRRVVPVGRSRSRRRSTSARRAASSAPRSISRDAGSAGGVPRRPRRRRRRDQECGSPCSDLEGPIPASCQTQGTCGYACAGDLRQVEPRQTGIGGPRPRGRSAARPRSSGRSRRPSSSPSPSVGTCMPAAGTPTSSYRPIRPPGAVSADEPSGRGHRGSGRRAARPEREVEERALGELVGLVAGAVLDDALEHEEGLGLAGVPVQRAWRCRGAGSPATSPACRRSARPRPGARRATPSPRCPGLPPPGARRPDRSWRTSTQLVRRKFGRILVR